MPDKQPAKQQVAQGEVPPTGPAYLDYARSKLAESAKSAKAEPKAKPVSTAEPR